MLARLLEIGAVVLAMLAVADSKLSTKLKNVIISSAETTWIKLSYTDVIRGSKKLYGFVSIVAVNLSIVGILAGTDILNEIREMFIAGRLLLFLFAVVFCFCVYIASWKIGRKIIGFTIAPIFFREIRLVGFVESFFRQIIIVATIF